MHNVEMWGWGEELAQVDFKVGYDIPKNVGMTLLMAKGEAWCFQFLKLRSDLNGLGVRNRLGLSTQGIRPFEIWEACEIGIGGVEGVATFNGEGGEVGIGGQIASGAERF